MTFLRVVSEHFPLFTSPERGHSDSSTKIVVGGGHLDEQRLPAIETEIPHCCFHCAQCGTPILLPHDGLGLPFGGPLVRRIEARSIGTVCPMCDKAGTYSLFHGCPGYNTRHRFVAARPRGNTVLLDWLHCEEQSCASPLPFFATFADQETEAELSTRAAGWNWEELLCTAGHTVKAPRWLFDPTLGRHPIDLSAAGARHSR